MEQPDIKPGSQLRVAYASSTSHREYQCKTAEPLKPYERYVIPRENPIDGVAATSSSW